MAAASKIPYTILIKGDPTVGVRYDCPFSHRATMYLAAKGIEYRERYLDTSRPKPQWFLDLNPAGTVPVLLTGPVDASYGHPPPDFPYEIIPDSGDIVTWLEAHHPNPPMAPAPGTEDLGANFFGAMKNAIVSPGDVIPTAEKEALEKELSALEAHLALRGPWFGGSHIDAVDCMLAPRLFHMQVALSAFKKWTLPEKYPYLIKYMKQLNGSDVFRRTSYAEQIIIDGWSPKRQ